jgi:hypothetical protein
VSVVGVMSVGSVIEDTRLKMLQRKEQKAQKSNGSIWVGSVILRVVIVSEIRSTWSSDPNAAEILLDVEKAFTS